MAKPCTIKLKCGPIKNGKRPWLIEGTDKDGTKLVEELNKNSRPQNSCLPAVPTMGAYTITVEKVDSAGRRIIDRLMFGD